MEAIIFSLLLFFSNADYSFASISALSPNPQTTTVSDENTQAYDDVDTVENSSGGKIKAFDVDGL
jgi:hypothetical protein